MRTKRLAAAAVCSGLLLCLLVSTSAAQERARKKAPIIRVYSADGGGVVSSYVRPILHVSENAYVFAVMIDLDGHIQVLHPDFPGISVRIESRKLLHLPNFFAGFNDQTMGSGYSQASYTRTGSGFDDSRGTVIALASRAPFNLELIEADGDWNMTAIRRIIEYRSPEAAAQMLARYLGAEGEPIGRDYMRIMGESQNYYGYNYAYNNLGYCGYGYSYRIAYFNALARIAELRAAGLRPLVLGYQCGIPVIITGDATVGGFRPAPVVRPPKDTTVFPKSHIPKVTIPRPVAEGVFPMPQRSGLQQIRDNTITAPRGRRGAARDPRTVPTAAWSLVDAGASADAYRPHHPIAHPAGCDRRYATDVPTGAAGERAIRAGSHARESETASPGAGRARETVTAISTSAAGGAGSALEARADDDAAALIISALD